MQSTERIVRNPSGFHARPAAAFVKTAARFASRITLENLDRASKPIDAKSILMVLASGAAKGHRVRITAEGPDEADAVETLGAFVDEGMGESIEG